MAFGADGDQSVQDDSEMTLPPSPSGPPQGQSQLLGWLTSSALADTVSACMADVTDAALRIKDEGSFEALRRFLSCDVSLPPSLTLITFG